MTGVPLNQKKMFQPLDIKVLCDRKGPTGQCCNPTNRPPTGVKALVSYSLKAGFCVSSCERVTDCTHLLPGFSTDLDEIRHGQSAGFKVGPREIRIRKYQCVAMEILKCGL